MNYKILTIAYKSGTHAHAYSSQPCNAYRVTYRVRPLVTNHLSPRSGAQ